MQVSILHMSMLDMYHDSHDQIMAIHKTPEMHEITHLMHNAQVIAVITSSDGKIEHTPVEISKVPVWATLALAHISCSYTAVSSDSLQMCVCLLIAPT